MIPKMMAQPSSKPNCFFMCTPPPLLLGAPPPSSPAASNPFLLFPVNFSTAGSKLCRGVIVGVTAPSRSFNSSSSARDDMSRKDILNHTHTHLLHLTMMHSTKNKLRLRRLRNKFRSVLGCVSFYFCLLSHSTTIPLLQLLLHNE